MIRDHAEAVSLIHEATGDEFVIAADLIDALRLGLRVVADRSAPSTHFAGGVPLVPAGFEWPVWNPATMLRSRLAEYRQLALRHPQTQDDYERLIDAEERRLLGGPVPLTFVAQFDLDAMAKAFNLHLPGQHGGSLLFFFDTATEPGGKDPGCRGGARVVHVNAPRATLTPAVQPTSRLDGATLDPVPLRLEPCWFLEGVQVGSWLRQPLRPLLQPGGRPQHRMLAPFGVRPVALRRWCQLATNGIDVSTPAYRNDRRARVLGRQSGDWKLLLQLDTDPIAGWKWGLMGRIIYCIRQQDLVEGDFESAWCIHSRM